jgi:hypothetical protein
MAKARKTRRRSRKEYPISLDDILKDPTIGEGKSKSIYVPPTTDDVAVLICFFNPINFKRPLKNLLYVRHILREQGIPCYVIECVFTGRKSQIPEADVIVHSATPMFYKEQLFNRLEKHVPEHFTKLVFIDNDIVFEAPDWVDQVSFALENHDVIMPYETACWLTPDNISIAARKKNLAWALKNHVPFRSLYTYHPGFAWAMRRDFFRSIGGFFDKKFLGAGDVAFGATFIPGITEKALSTFTGQSAVVDSYLGYYKIVQARKPRLGYLGFDAYHLFHGLRTKRGYMTRYAKIPHILKRGFEAFTIINEDGLYEFTDPELIEHAIQYFAARDEDIAITKALPPEKDMKLQKEEDPDPLKN